MSTVFEERKGRKRKKKKETPPLYKYYMQNAPKRAKHSCSAPPPLSVRSLPRATFDANRREWQGVLHTSKV